MTDGLRYLRTAYREAFEPKYKMKSAGGDEAPSRRVDKEVFSHDLGLFFLMGDLGLPPKKISHQMLALNGKIYHFSLLAMV